MTDEKIYVISTAFMVDDFIGIAHGVMPHAFRTREDARRYLLDRGWELSRFYDPVYDEEREFFCRLQHDAKIEEVSIK